MAGSTPEKFGYDYFHLDLGYGYARSEYTTPNASKFPRGLMPLTRMVCGLGLKMGFWTAPFEVSDRSWIYEHHKDWLVHNAEGEPIRIGETTKRFFLSWTAQILRRRTIFGRPTIPS
jgi:alpha-galactosidase